MTLSFTARSVTVSGVTAGNTIVLFAVGLQKNGYDKTLLRWAKSAADEDHDGAVTFDLERDIPTVTVAAAVDQTTGRTVIGAPPAFGDIERIALPATALRRSAAGANLDRFAFERPTLELLYVKPGAGAWSWSSMDGRTLDRDGANGVTVVAAGDGARLPGTTAELTQFSAGDVVVAIDRTTMQVAVGGAQ
jgi:hypothetical protein